MQGSTPLKRMLLNSERSLRSISVTGILVLVGLGTVLGLRPLFDPSALTALYGTNPALMSEMDFALMQHRAVTVAALGVALWIAALRPTIIPFLVPLVMVSKGLFIWLLWPMRSAAMTPIVFDIVALFLLAIVLVLHAKRRPG